MRHIIFGESHGPAIGVVLADPPAGVLLDWDFLRAEMARRAPGQDPTATARREVRLSDGKIISDQTQEVDWE